MKPTDFSYYLTNFLTKYLPAHCGASPNTISSYRDSFLLLLKFYKNVKSLPANKLKLMDFNHTVIEEFLTWLETERGCKVSTRNVRLAAIHSFFLYLHYEYPDFLVEWQKILQIPVKKTEKGKMNYMKPEGIELLLQQPNRKTIGGRRDLALLSLMYDTAARVQEIADLKVIDVSLTRPFTIKLTGKGNKTRIVPLMDKQVEILRSYMEERRLTEPFANNYPLFRNKQGNKLTRAGIGYILEKYIEMARKVKPELVPEKFSCHCLRHSKSMAMLMADVHLVYIRDFLGHVSVQTTERYARVDSSKKREAIEGAYKELTPPSEAVWEGNSDLMEWLKNFDK